MKKKVIIYYWHMTPLKGLKYKHNEEILDADPFEIAKEIFGMGYQTMIIPNKEDESMVTIGIDDKFFRQR